jgi:glycosyltransferase involved in cell wall biosynthesis
MRILQLISKLTGGGSERQLEIVSSELERRGHDVRVGYLRPGEGRWSSDVPTHRFPARHPRHPALIADAVRLLRSHKADVLQTWNLPMDVAGGISAAAAGVPWIVREASTAENYDGRVQRRLRFWVARVAAGAVVTNSHAGDRYWAANAPRLPRVIIPNAVPIEAIDASAPIERHPAVRIGVFAGRFVPMKNIDVLLRACASLMAERHIVLYLCGVGPERARLAGLAADLGIGARVRFTGFVVDMWPYLRAADFVALLSDFEGRPNIVTEAFAARAPVILSDIAAHRELVDGGAAALVPLRDVAATTRVICDVLDDPHAARQRVGRARRLAARWSVASVAAAFEEVYASVVEKKRAGTLRRRSITSDRRSCTKSASSSTRCGR